MSGDPRSPAEVAPGVSLRTVRLRDLPDVEIVDEAPDPAAAAKTTLEPDAPRGGRGVPPAVEQVAGGRHAEDADTVIVLEPDQPVVQRSLRSMA